MRTLKSLYYFFLKTLLSIYCYNNIKIYLSNHLNVGIWKLHKKKTIFPHPIGIVIGFNVKLGYNCTIFQNVTIGTKDTQDFKNGKYPELGNNVTVYPNSIIIGDITIGDNVIIGAGSIVLENIPSNSVVVGNPAKVIKNLKNYSSN